MSGLERMKPETSSRMTMEVEPKASAMSAGMRIGGGGRIHQKLGAKMQQGAGWLQDA
jgi:hypothetical protein